MLNEGDKVTFNGDLVNLWDKTLVGKIVGKKMSYLKPKQVVYVIEVPNETAPFFLYEHELQRVKK